MTDRKPEPEAEKVEAEVVDEDQVTRDMLGRVTIHFGQEIADLWLFCAGLWFCLLCIVLILIGRTR